MFGDNLNKKSLNSRVKWVLCCFAEDNSDKILDFENNDNINNAENKVSFISFCFEYIRFVKFMKNNDSVVFYTFLPIQLDASYNAYQHLVLLTKYIVK